MIEQVRAWWFARMARRLSRFQDDIRAAIDQGRPMTLGFWLRLVALKVELGCLGISSPPLPTPFRRFRND